MRPPQKWTGRLACVALWSMTAAALLTTPSPVRAATPTLDGLPDALRPWVPWIMSNHQETSCARLNERFVCRWPGTLTLTADAQGAAFELEVWHDRAQRAELPGSARFWPQEVQANGQALVVRAHGSGDAQRPAVELGPGRHVITGRLVWAAPPEVLQVPLDVGTLTLTVLGKRVERPRHDDQGRLWIREGAGGAQGAGEADNLRVSLYRKVIDGVPLKIVTRMDLNVSGRSRELSLGRVLVDKSLPVAVRSGLPVQLLASGEAKVYVRPGTHTIEIDALLPRPVASIAAPKKTPELFDPQEIWVWQPDEALRSVELGGLTTVDPGRTSLPQAWRGATTLLARDGEALTLKTTRRGEPDPAPNLIKLKRTMWLDLDGTGYTIKDTISGRLNQGWRLDYAQAGALGRVHKTSGDELLITKGLASGLDGVELREAKLSLGAESRHKDARSALKVVGWAHDVQSLQVDLNLPPGWSVLGASGVDTLGGTWLDSWTLFEFFVLLMIALSMGRLFGWPWALVAGVAMIFAHGQGDAPRYVWFHILGAIALLRVLPRAHWSRLVVMGYLGMVFIVFVGILGPFARTQLRYALNPQVESRWRTYEQFGGKFGNTSTLNMDAEDEIVAPVQERYVQQLAKADAPEEKNMVRSSLSSYDRSGGEGKRVSTGKLWTKKMLKQVDPNEVVQTGPGLPAWSWRTWQLRWSGPVFKDHEVRLWLISPTIGSLMRILSVLFFILMALVVLAPRRFAMRHREELFDVVEALKRLVAPAATVAIALLVAPLITPKLAHAGGPISEIPTSQLVQTGDMPPNVFHELERRLLAQQQCDGPCVVVPEMKMTIDGERVSMRATVHAQRLSGWLIPGPTSTLRLDRVRVDGVETRRLRREPSGLVAVRLTEGVHTVEVEGMLPSGNVTTLQFDAAARPRRIVLTAPQWSVDGVNDFGVPDTSLQLSRREVKKAAPGDKAATSERELEPWYGVTRVLSLGFPWQTQTIVRREDTARPALVKIPLLPGESVITEGVRVEEGVALVNFGRGEDSVTYTSELAVTPTLTLKAPEGVSWSETWTLECSRIWRCEHDKLVPLHTISNGSVYQPLWRPWPGEVLELTFKKPQGVPGQASTVTRVDYSVTPGQRLLRATLKIEVRASQGSFQRITLPEGAQLQEVLIDGKGRNLRPEGKLLTVPLKPGAQVIELRWQQPWKRALMESVPQVDLGSKAVNVNVSINLGRERWLLWTRGPQWGPAVLFWSHLALLLILAALLGRLEHLPMRTHQWLLLVIGMSQLPFIAIIPVVGWFVMFTWRERRPFHRAWLFDGYQLALIGATFVLFGVLYAAIHTNLLLQIDMQVQGADSSNSTLRWYLDRTDGKTPSASLLSAPLLVWRGAMLLWALWLVSQILRWVAWGWRAFSQENFWKPLRRRASTTEADAQIIADTAAHVAQGKHRAQTTDDDEEVAEAVEANEDGVVEEDEEDGDEEDGDEDEDVVR